MSAPFDPRPALDALSTGIAVVDGEAWSILFENAAFARWFPPGAAIEPAALRERLDGLDLEQAKARLAQGRPHRYEAEVKVAGRAHSLAVELRPASFGERACVLVECRDVSKQREAEYMLDSYARLAERNARELQKEKERAEKLLLNIMPRSVYEELKDFGAAMPQRFDQASVLMLDFVGFTEMAVAQDPGALVSELNDIFSAFDRIVELFGCERIKTIGDAYVAVSGLPEANPDHAANAARAALRMRRYLERRNAASPNQWRARIGLSAGPVIGSLVGIQKYVYDVFGPAVNLATRMEGLSEPMQITACEAFCALAQDQFRFVPRGAHDIKGFGRREIFTLEDELRDSRADSGLARLRA